MRITDSITRAEQITRGQVIEPVLLQVSSPAKASGELPVDETGGMLSEMFNFGMGQQTAAAGVLDNQIPSKYGVSQKLQPPRAVNEAEVGILEEGTEKRNHHHLSNINAHLPSSMQLSTVNHQVKAFSSPDPSSSPLQRFLVPNPSNCHAHGFQLNSPVAMAAGSGLGASEGSPVQFMTWLPGGGRTAEEDDGANKTGPGLSLSLSPSLQHSILNNITSHHEFEAAKLEELRVGNGGMFFPNQGFGGTFLDPYGSKNSQVCVGFGTSLQMVIDVVRNSKYRKAARDLLGEICSLGREKFKDHRPKKPHVNPNFNTDSGSSSLKELELPPLSAAEKSHFRRRKVELLFLLDEVDGRYKNYCEKMQAMVKSFDSVMGYGAAGTYTSMAHKAMCRHFRSIRNVITAQLRHTRELLGEKDATGMCGSSLTKRETPRLRMIDQSLRQQKIQMEELDTWSWRPQRGLPHRSVSILRAWLFDHFLHPYPTDADKHLLSRQTALSKNQVSNWFINARVRLWKPMVEEMYRKEAEEGQEAATTEEDVNSAQIPHLGGCYSISIVV